MAFQPQEKKALGLITSLYLVRMLGLFMVLPIIGLYGADLTGATPFLLGLALGIYGLTQALFQIPFGWASDRFGRKPVLLIGFAIFILGSLVCALSSSVEMLLLGRAIQGAGAVSAVLLALLADLIRVENRTTSMAVVGVSIGLSFGISVVLGPVIASFYQLQGVFVFSCLLGSAAFLIAALRIQQPVQEPVQEFGVRNSSEAPSLKTVLLNPDLARLDFSIFALHFLQMFIWVAVPGVLLAELEFSLDRHWLVYLIAVGGGFILMAPFMRFWDKRGKTNTSVRVAIIAILVAVLSMSKIEAYYFFILGLVLFFWGFNLLEATLPSALTKIADSKSKGTATGVYSTCQFLGVFFGGTAGGWILTSYGATEVFYFAAILCSVWLLIMAIRRLPSV